MSRFARKPPAPKPLSLPGKITLWVQANPQRPTPILWRLGLWGCLIGTPLLAGLVIWSGVRLIVDPYSAHWLTQVFPSLGRVAQPQRQTLAEMRRELQARHLTAGQPVALPAQPDQPRTWIVPILQARPQCTEACLRLVELQLYRGASGQSDAWQLLQQFSIQSPPESFVTAPLRGTATQVASVDQPAVLTQLTLLETALADGQVPLPWLLLSGSQSLGGRQLRYGQLLAYDPRSSQIRWLLDWTSPAGKPPFWQDLDGVGSKELLIDQTVGMEPAFLAYRVEPNQSLQEISLLQAVFDRPRPTYLKALQLASSGLWSPALRWMKTAQQELGQDWSPAATAQLNLVAAHAQLTRTQADRTWSSRNQQTLAYLIDSRWEAALKYLEDSPALEYQALLPLLETDFDRFWQRIYTMLQLEPQNPALQVWGGLLVSARQNAMAAQLWLQQQPQPQAALARFWALRARPQPIVAPVSNPTPTAVPSPAPAQPATAPANPAQYRYLVGQVTLLSQPDRRWYRLPGARAELDPQQRWYQIDLTHRYDDQSGAPAWQPMAATPIANGNQAAADLWQQLDLDAPVQRQWRIWQADTDAVEVTLQGLQQHGNQISVLASGPPLALSSRPESPILAVSEQAWQALDRLTPLPPLAPSSPAAELAPPAP